jgi:1-acyl-sn-glycerol-3-phosphate acyltransferase
MTRAALRGPRARDRVVVFLARLLARAFFRSVEVVGAPPPGGRVILAASHLNGFVDPVLLVAELGRLPRFLAKATLWSVAPARILLNFAGAVPVQRRVDAGDATDNRATFAAAVQALENSHVVAVFPEGTPTTTRASARCAPESPASRWPRRPPGSTASASSRSASRTRTRWRCEAGR